METYRAIGRRVAALRRARALTQERLAERARLSPSYVARVEAGAKQPTVAALAALAVALKVPLWRLFADRPREMQADRRRDTILQLLDGMSDADVEIVTGLVRRLAGG